MNKKKVTLAIFMIALSPVFFLSAMAQEKKQTASIHTPLVIAYVEVNDFQITCTQDYFYGKNKTPLFNQVNIFAANINFDSISMRPSLSMNDKVLTAVSNQNIAQLHKRGIKVVLDILGNHQNAGWGCFTSYEQANLFALEVADTLKKYHLDGVDIDDEYSACKTNDSSLVWATAALRKNLGNNKTISMVAFENYQYFKIKYDGKRVSDYLSFIIEETYDDTDYQKRIQPFLQMGISKNKIGIGTHLENADQKQSAGFVKKNHLACIMVYNVAQKNDFEKLSQVSRILYNETIDRK